MSIKIKKDLLKKALADGNGIVRLAPAWVPRSFLIPGGRLKLATRDIYALGAHRGGIDERWLASTCRADNGPATPEDEGQSYIVINSNPQKRILLKEAIELLGDEFLGIQTMNKYGGWQVLAKFFDNLGSIPHHVHQSDEEASKVGLLGKPEAYYFPTQLNLIENSFPYTYFGLEPGTKKQDVIRCLERWNEGDNGILNLTRAYKLYPGTGWDIPAGILHSPGSFVTYETQRASDVAATFQSMLEGRLIPRDLLVKNVPPEHHDDLEYIVNILDWEANADVEFVRNHYMEPCFVTDPNLMGDFGYKEVWVSYRSEYFSAKELTVFPGRSVIIHDQDAYGLLTLQGRGLVGKMEVESPTLIRFKELTADELFVTKNAARELQIVNTSNYENLVMLKHFGPGNPDVLRMADKL